MSKRGIGELLVQESIIDVDQLAKAKTEQKKSGVKLTTAMVKLGYVKEEKMLDYIAQQYQTQAVDLDNFDIDADIIKLVPKEICLKHAIIPVMKSLGTLVVACTDPSNIFVRDDLNFITQSKIEMVVASETAIISAISKYYESSKIGSVMSDLEESEEALAVREEVDQGPQEIDAPIIRFVNTMLIEAVKSRASDIHIEPYEKRFRVRFRIDGTLHEKIQPPAGTAGAISSRIKIMSGLDISERRRPQDGRLSLKKQSGEPVDFRVSTIPTLYGEKICLRFLDKSSLSLPMQSLGFEESDMELIKDATHRPNGIVLITGPTGSGKSTTVYSVLNDLNTPDVNLCTAEDPVEMNVEGINHVAAFPQIGVTFSTILRSFLRQDPDVIFVGEIRDLETAEVSFKAASTGHLVVSTLHTNDAPATIVRLTEIGIAPYLVTSTVSLVVAQRLIGRICENCKVATSVNSKVLLDLGVKEDEINEFDLMRGEGCGQCNQTGIKGRVAIHECMKITPGVKEAILEGATSLKLREIAVAEGMRSLRLNALLKLKRGLTTLEAVIHATVEE